MSRAAFHIKPACVCIRQPPIIDQITKWKVAPSMSAMMPMAAMMLAMPHRANTMAVRFCIHAKHSSAPEHAIAKLCMTMRVGRSRVIVPVPLGLSTRRIFVCVSSDQRRGDSSNALTL
jgi:hypothetical protein